MPGGAPKPCTFTGADTPPAEDAEVAFFFSSLAKQKDETKQTPKESNRHKSKNKIVHYKPINVVISL